MALLACECDTNPLVEVRKMYAQVQMSSNEAFYDLLLLLINFVPLRNRLFTEFVIHEKSLSRTLKRSSSKFGQKRKSISEYFDWNYANRFVIICMLKIACSSKIGWKCRRHDVGFCGVFHPCTEKDAANADSAAFEKKEVKNGRTEQGLEACANQLMHYLSIEKLTCVEIRELSFEIWIELDSARMRGECDSAKCIQADGLPPPAHIQIIQKMSN